MRPAHKAVLLLGLLPALTGCATKALWENPAFSGFNEPARPANLQVFKAKDDWLVVYDEVNENSDRIRRRAYYAMANRGAINGRRQPLFAHASDSKNLRSVPAVVSRDGKEFTLYEGEERVGVFDLPVYAAPSGRVKQVLLTPATVIADASIVGGYIGLYWWANCGGGYSP